MVSMMYRRGSLYDWSDYSTEKLKKALELYHQLEDLGFPQNDDLLYVISVEIKNREKKQQ